MDEKMITSLVDLSSISTPRPSKNTSGRGHENKMDGGTFKDNDFGGRGILTLNALKKELASRGEKCPRNPRGGRTRRSDHRVRSKQSCYLSNEVHVVELQRYLPPDFKGNFKELKACSDRDQVGRK